MIVKYIDIDYIIERVYRRGFDLEINTDDILEWTWDVVGKLGIPWSFVEKITNGEGSFDDPIAVTNYRGKLPTDLFSITLVRDYDTKMPMYCTSSPFKSDSELYSELQYESQNTYHVSGDYIYTSFEEGSIELVYKAFPTSPLGLPQVPDEPTFIEALESYMAFRIAEKMWLQDRMSKDKFEYFRQQKLFNMASAYTSSLIPTIDEMEAIKNRFCRLKQNPNLHDASFRYIADKERLILHNNIGR